MKFKGVNNTTSELIRGDENIAKDSGLSLAILFGVISPKISTTTVITAVETVAPRLSSFSNSTKSIVPRDAARIFTILFPTRIVFNNFSFLSKSFPARIALLSFLFLKSRNLNLLIDRKALSEAEKIIESKIRTTAKINSPVIDDESDVSMLTLKPRLLMV